MSIISGVLWEIVQERQRQDAKWGTHRDLTDFQWLTVIVEEVGEIGRAILQNKHDDVHKEIVQVAAVAVAWLECIAEFAEERTGKDFKNG
jgi:NTP pyrophosphatase (non-canonical NTP hydrolase)